MGHRLPGLAHLGDCRPLQLVNVKLVAVDAVFGAPAVVGRVHPHAALVEHGRRGRARVGETRLRHPPLR